MQTSLLRRHDSCNDSCFLLIYEEGNSGLTKLNNVFKVTQLQCQDLNPSSLTPELVRLTNPLCCLPYTYYSQKQQTHTHINNMHTEHTKYYPCSDNTHIGNTIYTHCTWTHTDE